MDARAPRPRGAGGNCRRKNAGGARNVTFLSEVDASASPDIFCRIGAISKGHFPNSSHGAAHDHDIRIGQMAGWYQGRQRGAISTKSGALNDYPYGFASRFEGKPGSNPEELIGAAHAACFTMALSLILGEAKLTAEQMETKADVTLEKQGDGFAITSVHLTLTAKDTGRRQGEIRRVGGHGQGRVPGIEAVEYQDHAGRDAGPLILRIFAASRRMSHPHGSRRRKSASSP